jgi:hypothetical protein
LKPLQPPDDASGRLLGEALEAARGAKAEVVRTALSQIQGDPTGDYLAGAGRVVLVARDLALAQSLFKRALERDPSSYRAASAATRLRQRVARVRRHTQPHARQGRAEIPVRGDRRSRDYQVPLTWLMAHG